MFTTRNLTKKKVPAVPFLKLADFVLGKKYELSLVLAEDVLTKKLNSQYRHQNKPTNILSFPYAKKMGEVFINLNQAEQESKLFAQNYMTPKRYPNHTSSSARKSNQPALAFFSPSVAYKNYLAYLFIHGLLHLKGYEHSSKMESEECKILKRFKKSL